MRRSILLSTILCFFYTYNLAQEDSYKAPLKLDVLRAPNSPAANLLRFATSDVQKPTDVTDFMLSLQTATSNYSVLPSAYTVDIAPFWLLKSKGMTIDKMQSNKFKDLVKQTLILSVGIRNPDSTQEEFNHQNFYNSFGIKLSLLRGKFTDETNTNLSAIVDKQATISKSINDRTATFTLTDSIFKKLLKDATIILAKYGSQDEAEKHADYNNALAKTEERRLQISNSLEAEFQKELEDLESVAKKFKIIRYGPFIDFAGGLSLEYVNRNFNRSRVYNAGAWLTFGYEWQSGFSVLGITRYLYNPDKAFADDGGLLDNDNISTFDAGARAIYSTSGRSKFNFSAEGIYRSILGNSIVDPSWRFVINAEYDIGNNQLLTFSYGREFDGTITKDGNIIAALNFIKGFGSSRK